MRLFLAFALRHHPVDFVLQFLQNLVQRVHVFILFQPIDDFSQGFQDRILDDLLLTLEDPRDRQTGLDIPRYVLQSVLDPRIDEGKQRIGLHRYFVFC